MGERLPVSIHAPARGATGDSTTFIAAIGSFNPRSRTGSDVGVVTSGANTFCFNPRSRTGSDTRSDGVNSSNFSFNPRSRTGSDVHIRCVQDQDHVSIHAPARGATFVTTGSTLKAMFQSTLPHGERHYWLTLFDSAGLVSIHAPARGAT